MERDNDYGSEGEFFMDKGDQLSREFVTIDSRFKSVEDKVTKIVAEGCAHRGNDLQKIERIERVAESIRMDVASVTRAMADQSLALERAGRSTDSKFHGLKVWALAQVVIMLLGLCGYLWEKFAFPHMRNDSVEVVQKQLDMHRQKSTYDHLDAIIPAHGNPRSSPLNK